MTKFLTIVAVALMSILAFNTAQADAREELLAAVKVQNEACPVGDDITLKSVKVEGDNLVLTYVMSVTKAELDMCKSAAGDIIESMVSDLRGEDESFNNLFTLCKSANCNLIFRFSNPQGDYIDMELPCAKL